MQKFLLKRSPSVMDSMVTKRQVTKRQVKHKLNYKDECFDKVLIMRALV